MCDDKRKVNFLEQLSLLCPQAGDLLGVGRGEEQARRGERVKMKTKVSFLVFVGYFGIPGTSKIIQHDKNSTLFKGAR